MAFDIETWRDKIQERLTAWPEHWQRLKAAGGRSIYTFLSVMTLWPVVEAAQKGDWAALVVLGSVAAGVGSNLLANRIQSWKDEADAVRDLDQQATDSPDTRAALNTILERLDILPQAREALPADEREQFVRELREELCRLDSLPRFEATLIGSGVIAQRAETKIVGERGILIEGNVYCTGPQTGELGLDAVALREAYLSRIFEVTRWLPLGGIDPRMIGEAEESCLSLAQIYTTLDTMGTGVLEESHPERIIAREDRRISAVAVMNEAKHLVLLGDSGSGKSTFLNFVALCMAAQCVQPEIAGLAHLGAEWTHGWMLPIRVVLREFAARGLPPVGERATGDHLWCFLETELGKSLAEYAPLLRKDLLEKGGLILLDGLDEVPEAEWRRAQVKDVILGFAAAFPRCRFVLTSRTYAYQQQGWRLPGFQEAVLAPFNDKQIEAFIERWYVHIATLPQRGFSREDAQGWTVLLKRALATTPGLRTLACRPLLLTLMASLHAWRGGALPEKREELYNDAVDLLLNIWEQVKVIRDAQGKFVVVQPAVREWLEAPRGQVLRALEEVAYKAHAGQETSEGAAVVEEKDLVDALLRISGNPDLKPTRVMEYIRDRAGLLMPNGVGKYTFLHRTFQEYMAARHLTEQDWPREMARRVWERPEHWREVALLAAAKAARGVSYAAWTLIAALCSGEPGEEPDLREAWAASIAAQALVDLGLHIKVPEWHQGEVERLHRWLVVVLRRAVFPPVERAAAGRSLAYLDDARFCPEAFFLPDEPLLAFVEVPAGPFLMGSTEADEMAYSDEKPQHSVHVPAFYIARYPVTNAQFHAFVETGGYRERRYWTEEGWIWCEQNEIGGPNTDIREPLYLPNHPVEGVNWYEALAYCHWLTEVLQEWEGTPDPLAMLLRDRGWMVGLPSEAQWEKAARGTDGRIFPWGDGPDPNLANYDKTGVGTTNAVGCFPRGKSFYGMEEMSGNVWEWTQSLRRPYPYDVKDGRESIKAKGFRVRRGGAWDNAQDWVRCACRGYWDPSDQGGYVGFRCTVSVGVEEST